MSGYSNGYLVALKAEIDRLTEQVERYKRDLIRVKQLVPDDHNLIAGLERALEDSRNALLIRILQFGAGFGCASHPTHGIYKTVIGLGDAELHAGDTLHG